MSPRSSLKVIGQGHQDQCHYLKKRSEGKVVKVKVRVQGHKVKVTIKNQGHWSRSPRSNVNLKVIRDAVQSFCEIRYL